MTIARIHVPPDFGNSATWVAPVFSARRYTSSSRRSPAVFLRSRTARTVARGSRRPLTPAPARPTKDSRQTGSTKRRQCGRQRTRSPALYNAPRKPRLRHLHVLLRTGAAANTLCLTGGGARAPAMIRLLTPQWWRGLTPNGRRRPLEHAGDTAPPSRARRRTSGAGTRPLHVLRVMRSGVKIDGWQSCAGRHVAAHGHPTSAIDALHQMGHLAAYGNGVPQA
jgi:hypothetical protein